MEEQPIKRPIERPNFPQHCCTILRGIAEAVFICDGEGRIVLKNQALCDLAGNPKKELVHCMAADIEPPELAQMILQENDAVLADGKMRSFEFVLPLPGGLRFFWVTKGLCAGGNGGVFGSALDITEIRRVEREIIDTSDREKERLGHELRENFCQHLVGISLLANVLYEELSKAGLEQARYAYQITTLVKEVVSEIRTLEKSLSVSHLEQGDGLVEALRELAELVRIQNGVECLLRVPAAKPAVRPETAMHLFRIAQEAIKSALHRGPVRRLLIRLTFGRGGLVLAICDDGTKIPRKTNFDEWARAEFPIMRYRSQVMGAKLEFKRHRPSGVEVVCSMPCYRQKKSRPKMRSSANQSEGPNPRPNHAE